ncbi:murein biosynthesis integral membrane protein MurJ [Porphyrobacter sp. CACIAM 03H1]|uniref:murein biosynthesis integral membrane protein MurJ n=1 Tax=Porphyrobacter sp. CACIAM 03H1 TaxID=2003315 RepID=UPI000B5A976D|nr:murein biosynthesis integral membrane protein MurJ [Porphyrobacter sp. CACIAM 03H1]ASJ92305.1 murein biosynthesis integral membrane protein MurJ [Porphyrobacter sp. CACIAM 03H1]
MSLLKNVGTIGGLTLVSRLFGFARDILLARVLGAGGAADAWQLAFQLPNLFRRLFAEGAFASAFVPLFNRQMAEDENAARRFAGEVLAVLLPILVVFGALMMLAMPWVLWAFANEDLRGDAAMFDLAVTMGRIAFPYLMFMSLATLVAAILNSLSRFAAAAAAPILLNICLLTALVWGALQPAGETTRAMTGVGLAIAVSVSGLLQLLWLYWFMRRAGFRIPRAAPRVTAGVKEMGVLIVPAVFGAGVYQISRFIDLAFIRGLPDGSLTYMAMADRWNQLPLGVIGIALGTAVLPALSRYIAQSEDEEAVRLQANAIELAMLLTLPCAVALFITGFAFVKAFMEGQAFTAEDARLTGMVTSALVVGLPAYVLVKVLTPNFFARKDTRTPVYTAAASLVVTVALNFLLVPMFGVVGLALAGALGAWVNIALLGTVLARRGYFRLPARVLGRIGRIALAAAAMGAALWALMQAITPWLDGPFTLRLAAVGAILGTSLVSYGAATVLLGVLDKATVQRLMRRQS